MKKFLTAIALLGSLSLAACDAATVSQVQQNVVKACGFLPAVQTVEGVLTTFAASTLPAVQIADLITNGICNAVGNSNKSVALKRSAGPVTFRGIAIEGSFVK